MCGGMRLLRGVMAAAFRAYDCPRTAATPPSLRQPIPGPPDKSSGETWKSGKRLTCGRHGHDMRWWRAEGQMSSACAKCQCPTCQAPSFWRCRCKPVVAFLCCPLPPRPVDTLSRSDIGELLFPAATDDTSLKSNQLFVRRGLAASEKTLIASLVSFRPCLSPPDLRDRPPSRKSPFPAMLRLSGARQVEIRDKLVLVLQSIRVD